MLGTIIASAITGILALIGVIYTNINANKEIEHKIMTSQEVTNVEIRHLTEEVKKCTDCVERIPKLEVRVDKLEESVKELRQK